MIYFLRPGRGPAVSWWATLCFSCLLRRCEQGLSCCWKSADSRQHWNDMARFFRVAEGGRLF